MSQFNIHRKWELIYRASRDNFEGSKFHSKCDKKPNTLVIIKSINGNVFGGFTKQNWSLLQKFKSRSAVFVRRPGNMMK